MIVWLTNTDAQHERLKAGLHAEQKVYPIEGMVADVRRPGWESYIEKETTVLVSLMGGQALGDEVARCVQSAGARCLYLGYGPGVRNSVGATADQVATVQAYIAGGGPMNYMHVWRYLAQTFEEMETCAVPAPQAMPEAGLYYPGEAPYETVEDYMAAHIDPDRPTVGFLFLRDEWLWGKTAFFDRLVAVIEDAGMNALPLFTYWASPKSGAPGIDTYVERFFYCAGKVIPNVVINHHRMSMRLGRVADRSVLDRLGVPVLQAYHAKRSYEEWSRSQTGLTPTEVSSTVAMMECDGILHGAVVSHRGMDERDEITREPWEYGMDLLVRKAAKWAALQRKPNAEKKVAIVLHNYPANNAHVGCAAELDSPTSLYRLLEAMKKDGYDIGELPDSPEMLWQEVMSTVTNDRRYMGEGLLRVANRLSGQEVAEYEKRLSQKMQDELTRDWGEAPGEVFVDGTDLLVPGTVRGKVYIALQPPRGFGENTAAIIHSPDLVPTHHYVAYYHYLRSVWGADALIHLGTHGSQEWLPGKQMGQSDSCYSLVTIDDVPNIYPYLVTVVGEGIQAKRRGGACLIGYLPAPSEPSGVYGDWAKMEPLLEEYAHFQRYQPEHTEIVLEQITEQVAKLGMEDYFGDSNGREEDYVLAIHNFMHELTGQASRTGLHVLGEAPQGDGLTEWVYRVTEVAQGEMPSLPAAMGRAMGIDYDGLGETAQKTVDDCRAMTEVETASRNWLRTLASRNWDPTPAADMPWSDELAKLAKGIATEVVPRFERITEEITNILGGLNGRMVSAGPGGSPSSGNWEILPTGRNYYGTDPSLLPTPTAWKLGMKLGDALLEQYVAEEGRYPEQVGIVVWAGPNLRSNGQCLAEIMYLLGVRPVWRPESGKVAGLEVISPEELGRPRIDVTARISGLVRDALPQAVALINQAVGLVAEQDEPEEVNYIRKHIRKDSADFAASGMSSEEAWKAARYRVFGCPPNAYGAGVGGALDSREWENVQDLAQVYVAWGGYAYDEQGTASDQSDVFKRRLATLDVTVKNEDTKDIHLMSSDDFNAYHGGMIAASRALGGKVPRSYVGDSSRRSQVRVQTLEETFYRVLHAEALHPRFIEGMMKHGHKGALELAKYTSLAFSWDATSDMMNDASYQRLTEAYVLDERVRKWMQDVNPWAVHEIVETLLEAKKRGMWNMPDEIAEALQDIYLQMEGSLEEGSE